PGSGLRSGGGALRRHPAHRAEATDSRRHDRRDSNDPCPDRRHPQHRRLRTARRGVHEPLDLYAGNPAGIVDPYCSELREGDHLMPSELRSPRLAVLSDADNASAKIVDGLFEEIAKIGEASVRRIYGDFSSARSKAWAEALSKHAIIPQQQIAHPTATNPSDRTLLIDA